MRVASKFAQRLVGLLGLIAVGFAAPVRAGQDSDKDRIVSVIETYQDALNGSNVDGVLEVYAPDGVFMPEFSPASVGLPEVRAAYEKVFKAIDLDVKFRIAEVVVLSDDWALVRTTSDGTIRINASGAKVGNDSKELFLLRKQRDGTWKFARYAFSSNVRS